MRAVEAALTLKTAVFLSSGGDLVRYPCFIVPGTRNRFSICSYIFFFGALSLYLSLLFYSSCSQSLDDDVVDNCSVSSFLKREGLLINTNNF